MMHAGMVLITHGLPDGEVRDDDVGAAHEEDVPKVEVVVGYVDAGKVLVAADAGAAQRNRRRDESQRVLVDPGVPDDHHLLEGS